MTPYDTHRITLDLLKRHKLDGPIVPLKTVAKVLGVSEDTARRMPEVARAKRTGGWHVGAAWVGLLEGNEQRIAAAGKALGEAALEIKTGGAA